MVSDAEFLLILEPSGSSASAPFSPSDLDNGVLWLDASDSDTLFQDSAGTTPADEDADVVGLWKNKFADQYHVSQATTANKPTFNSSSQAIDFDGVDDELSSASLFGISGTSAATIFFAIKLNILAATGFAGISSDGGSFGRLDISSELGLRFSGGNELYNQALGTNPSIVRAQNPATPIINDYQMFLNAAEVSVSSSTSGASSINLNGSVSKIGSRSGTFLDGLIYEIIIFNRLLTSAEAAQVEAYLSTKWSITLS